MSKFRSRATLAAVAALAMIGAACASDSSTSSAAGGSSSVSTGTGVCAGVDTSTGDLLAQVCESGSLTIATDPKYKPQSWYDVQSGEWNGFDVEVANDIANRLGVTADVQPVKWAKITAGSWLDQYDVSVGSMTDTVDRESLFYFTPAYYYTPAVISVASDNTTITGPADLDGKKICVGISTTYQDYVEGDLVLGSGAPPFEFQIPSGNQPVTFETDTDALDALALGDGEKCDAAISAQQTIQAFIDEQGPIKIVGEPLYYEPLSIAFDKNAPTNAQSLSDAVSQIVDDMHADGTLSELSKKWYNGVDWTTTSAGEGTASSSPS